MLISVICELVEKGQFKICTDLKDISYFGRNASKFCHLKVFNSKKTVKEMYFIKKYLGYCLFISNGYNNLKHRRSR